MKLSVDSTVSLGGDMKNLFTSVCGETNPGKDQKIALAVGRQFFNKIDIALQIDIGKSGNPDVYKIGLHFKGSPGLPKKTSAICFFIMLLGLAGIAMLLMTVFKGKTYRVVSRNVLASYSNQNTESL